MSREEFERAWKTKHKWHNLNSEMLRSGEGYFYSDAHIAWEWWQAACKCKDAAYNTVGLHLIRKFRDECSKVTYDGKKLIELDKVIRLIAGNFVLEPTKSPGQIAYEKMASTPWEKLPRAVQEAWERMPNHPKPVDEEG